jgi:hypothetical protein
MKHHMHQKKGYTCSSAYKTLAWFWMLIYQKASDRGSATSICNGPTNHLHLHDFQHQHWLASCRSERSSSSKSSFMTALNHVQHFSKSKTFIVSLGPQLPCLDPGTYHFPYISRLMGEENNLWILCVHNSRSGCLPRFKVCGQAWSWTKWLTQFLLFIVLESNC